MIDNNCVFFKSKIFCYIYIYILGTTHIKQGSYCVYDLIKRFSLNKNINNKQIYYYAAKACNDYAIYGFQVDEFFIYNLECLSKNEKISLLRKNYHDGIFMIN